MKITQDTKIGELMILLRDSQDSLVNWFDDPIISFNLYSDGSFEINESFYKVSATCNSTVDINNNFTGFDISKNMLNRLNQEGKL